MTGLLKRKGVGLSQDDAIPHAGESSGLEPPALLTCLGGGNLKGFEPPFRSPRNLLLDVCAGQGVQLGVFHIWPKKPC